MMIDLAEQIFETYHEDNDMTPEEQVFADLGYTREPDGWHKDLARFTIYITNYVDHIEDKPFKTIGKIRDGHDKVVWKYEPILEGNYIDSNFAWYEGESTSVVWEDPCGGKIHVPSFDNATDLRLWLIMSEADLLKSAPGIIASHDDV